MHRARVLTCPQSSRKRCLLFFRHSRDIDHEVAGAQLDQADALRVAASEQALDAVVGGLAMKDLAREALAIAEEGLKARAVPGAGGMIVDERHFLNALHDSMESGQVPADELIEKFSGEWAGDLTRIYAEYSY